ncbi:MAG: aconitase X, partial [Dongiaceae bacterium]
VGLFHLAGITPEAPTAAAACGHRPPQRTVRLAADMLRAARDRLSTAKGEAIDAVALGSPHFSLAEFAELERQIAGQQVKVPFFVCTGRAVVHQLQGQNRVAPLENSGVTIVADTCVVVTPILPAGSGVLMTNSGKFAHYGPANTGYEVIYGSLADCVASAVAGKVMRDESLWQ